MNPRPLINDHDLFVNLCHCDLFIYSLPFSLSIPYFCLSIIIISHTWRYIITSPHIHLTAPHTFKTVCNLIVIQPPKGPRKASSRFAATDI